jgi:subtilase family serine protease
MRKITMFTGVLLIILGFNRIENARAGYSFDAFNAKTPMHILGMATSTPQGLSPSFVKKAYHLASSGGSGTIAIITAYHSATIENDLEVFNKKFGIVSCTVKNKCLIRHAMDSKTKADPEWSLETSLDVEWAHAIAPQARILLVEAASPSGKNLMKAIDYARSQKDVVAVSMSWGGPEFPDELALDAHFTGGPTFFAASGDNGNGVSWPAVSPNVVAVGGTGFIIDKVKNTLIKEYAWKGSGGGVSAYEPQPSYQSAYDIPRSHRMRAIPDVSYNADPASGYSVYSGKGWYVIGGTSAGAPQWAAIQALGHSASNQKFYADKSYPAATSFFRDIVSGDNGACSYYCDARKRYDYVTGLGSPMTTKF